MMKTDNKMKASCRMLACVLAMIMIFSLLMIPKASAVSGDVIASDKQYSKKVSVHAKGDTYYDNTIAITVSGGKINSITSSPASSASDTSVGRNNKALAEVKSRLLGKTASYNVISNLLPAQRPDAISGATYSWNAFRSAILDLIYNASATFYAQLVYDANGGSNVPEAESVQSASGTGVSVSIPFNVTDTVPTRTNYTFLGWSKSKTASTASYAAGDICQISATSSVSSAPTTETLYAVWQEETSGRINLTFNANGGENTPEAQSNDAGRFSIPEQEPTWTDHVFLGWGTSRDTTKVLLS